MKRLTLLFAGLLLLTACTAQDVEQYQQRIQVLQGEIDTINQEMNVVIEEINQAQQALADAKQSDTTLTDEQVDEITSKVREGLTFVDMLTEKSKSLEAALAKTRENVAKIEAGQDPSIGVGMQVAGETAKSVGAILPPPWNAIVTSLGVLLGGAGAGVARREVNRRRESEGIAENIVSSIETAKAVSGGAVDFSNDSIKVVLNASQKPETKAFIDKQQNK